MSSFPPLGADAAPLLSMYERYCRDPASVPADWRLAFAGLDGGSGARADILSERALRLVDAYRRDGYRAAALDPLGLAPRDDVALDAAQFGLADAEGETVDLQALGFGATTVGALTARLAGAYCGTLALEAAHVHERALRDWLHAAFEAPRDDAADGAATLGAILRADEFERFMAVKFPGKRRFGLEGGEAQIVFVETALAALAAAGAEEVVIGGMHRGRLNLLANVLGKPVRAIVAEMTGAAEEEDAAFLGDMPYHVGVAATRSFGGRALRLSLAPHPSHLMVVAPVTLGRVRAKQGLAGADGQRRVVGLLLHTDAAFAGQGLTAELFQVSRLPGYAVGGTLHLVVNNQVGFTTEPGEGRSSRACTDIAKLAGAPVLHVNADDPDAVAQAARIAAECRGRFGCDVVVDLVCYRRHGHNELDEPRFTQPHLYRAVDAQPSVRRTYAARCVAAGRATEAGIEAAADAYRATLQAEFAAAEGWRPNAPAWLQGRWAGIGAADEAALLAPVETGVAIERLRDVGRRLAAVPPGIEANPKVAAFQMQRLAAIEAGAAIPWATAEALALGSLLDEGCSVRLSGQDSVRGTYAHRHLALHDMRDGRAVVPLAALARAGARCEVVNSPLAEYVTLGMEFGASLVDPQALVIWEAQFGDFANLAQAVIDQFVAASESKWRRLSGLVMLLPHGMEGGGPEHSSARPERFLLLCARANMIVANCSTPASYFHILRRQLAAPWRKPLVLLTPKSLLRHKDCVSPLDAMAAGTGFRPLLDEAPPGPVRRVVLCSGKFAYEILRARADAGAGGVAVLRLEQLYPLPETALRRALARWPGAEVAWVQEEPENQGAWPWLERRLAALVAATGDKSARLRYIGRPAEPAPAGGGHRRHERDQAAIAAAAVA